MQPTHARLPYLRPALLLACLAPASRADVLVVAADGSGNYTQINQAIVAAVEGDVLLVKSGTYFPFVVPGKELAIVADEGANVIINGYAAVIGLAAGKTVLLSGLHATAQSAVQYGLFLDSNDGAVRLQDSSFGGWAPPPVSCSGTGQIEAGGAAARVASSNDVAFVRCQLHGGNGGDATDLFCLDTGGTGGAGLEAQLSTITLYETAVLGGEGGTSGYSGRGGDGARLVASRLFASGEAFVGGDAGANMDVIWLCQSGGTGLFVDASSEARLLDVQLQGGAKGDFDGCGQDGLDQDGTGSVTIYPDLSRRLHAQRVAREGSSLQVTLEGLPGDSVRLMRSPVTRARHLPVFQGTALVGPPASWTLQVAGTLDATGTLVLSIPLGSLPPSIEATELNLQALFEGQNNARVLGSSAHLVIVDSSF